MSRRLSIVVGIAVTAIAADRARAVDYTVGLRFDDGSTVKTIGLSDTATLELFITTEDDAAAMKEFLIGFSASTASQGGTLGGLAFSSSQDSLANWDYSASSLDGLVTSRFSTALAASPADDVFGPFTELVVDSIEITPLEEGEWTLAPDPLNFDVIIADRNDPTAGSFLDAAFSSVTLIVPEPASIWLLGIGAFAVARRRRR